MSNTRNGNGDGRRRYEKRALDALNADDMGRALVLATLDVADAAHAAHNHTVKTTKRARKAAKKAGRK